LQAAAVPRYTEVMGAWGTELLENDTACDEIGDIVAELVASAVAASAKDISPKAAGRFAAELALIAQYAAYTVPDACESEALQEGVAKHRGVLLQVAPKAAKLLDVLVSGNDLGDISLAPLFDAKHARVYLQELADECIDECEDNLENPRTGARLHVLMVIAPYVELPGKTLRHWQRRFREAVDEADDDEQAFLRPYMTACKKLVAAAASDDDDDSDGD
jgi:hypothetical protein